MRFFLDLNIHKLSEPINHNHKLMLMGSCFTEHIGGYLIDNKFSVHQNPYGILFDPMSVCSSLVNIIEQKRFNEPDFFYANELWASYELHSSYSRPDLQGLVHEINQTQERSHEFLKTADWLIITLGSSFYYWHKDLQKPVANCHKTPQRYFEKRLATIEEIITELGNLYYRLLNFNPHLNLMLTISPVRHLRDGLVENNISKARLIEAVHHICGKFSRVVYFPAYEIVIDVLRDYRFYDIDLAHPNFQATKYVMERFEETCFNEETKRLNERIGKIVISSKHKPFHPSSNAHQQFKINQLKEIGELKSKYPFLDFNFEETLFSSTRQHLDTSSI